MAPESSPPTWLVRLWEAAGAAGVVASIVGLVFFYVAIGQWANTLEASLQVTSKSIVAVDRTIGVLDDTLVVFEEALVGVGSALGVAGDTLENVVFVAESVVDLMGTDLPAQVDAITVAMDGLIDTAGVVDGILGAAAIFGVDYEPDVPLDQALREVDNQLAELPVLLQQESRKLARTVRSLGVFTAELATISVSVEDLGVQIEESRELIENFELAAADAQLVVTEASESLPGQVFGLRLLVGVLMLALAVLFSKLWWDGRAART